MAFQLAKKIAPVACKMKEHRNVGILETTFRAKVCAISKNESMRMADSLDINFVEGSY